MKAIVYDNPGDEDVLHLGQAPDPGPPPAGHVRIAVRAAGLNRADLLQRQGKYPPPPGASELLGLEAAGVVVECGAGVTDFRPGHRVMALLPGGGYAEQVVAHAGSVLPVPAALSDEEAGGFMETFLTAFLNLFLIGETPADATVLIHGGGSGVGTSALALCREAGVRAFVTVGSDERGARCRALGAERAINYREGDFADAVREATGGRGVDRILDHIGARYLAQDIYCLAVEGRLIVIGSMGGLRAAELDVGTLIAKRLRVIGSTLRALPVERKAAIVAAFSGQFGAALGAGRLKPVVHRVFPLAEAAAAHRMMAAGSPFGKIVLRVAE